MCAYIHTHTNIVSYHVPPQPQVSFFLASCDVESLVLLSFFLNQSIVHFGRMWGFTPLVSNGFGPPRPEPLARPPRLRPLPLGADEDEAAFAGVVFKLVFLSSTEKSPWVSFSKEEETVELSELELPSPLLFLTDFEPSFDSLAFLFLVVGDVLSGISSSSSISASGLLPSINAVSICARVGLSFTSSIWSTLWHWHHWSFQKKHIFWMSPLELSFEKQNRTSSGK